MEGVCYEYYIIAESLSFVLSRSTLLSPLARSLTLLPSLFISLPTHPSLSSLPFPPFLLLLISLFLPSSLSVGAGVGGEYPLAATVTSESSSAASRGRLMAAVFAMQGVSAAVRCPCTVCRSVLSVHCVYERECVCLWERERSFIYLV